MFIFGQGCSDAGLCTVSGLDTGFENSNTQTTVQYSTIIGLGEQNALHLTTQFEIIIPTIKNQTVQLKIPYNFTFGNLGNISGLGDLSLTINQRLFSVNKLDFNAVAGLKIPSNDANKSLNAHPLPMAYQTSLGTYDVILGISTKYRNWHFSFGYQHSFGHNLNEFIHTDSNPQYFNNYNESYHLQRADDIMLRIEKEIKTKNYSLIFGVLPIYHLGDDKINDGQDVPNSSGLTLNLNASAVKKLENNSIMKLILAAPIIDREVRPDGLTRSFIIVFSYNIAI
ncbi:MAG: hypothetical protein DRJ10_20870 [Bacteroidetes bacterium]|nr:MAG: hypothetical protein DRJ10_20870 [Bacteroidota bacterium]